MKTVLLYCFLIITTLGKSQQDLYYFYKGGKIYLTPLNDKVVVKFVEGLTFEEKNQIIISNGLLKPLDEKKSEKIPDIVIAELKERDLKPIDEIISELNRNKSVIVANCVLKYKDNTEQGMLDEFVVKLNSPADYSKLQDLANKTNTKIIKQNPFKTSVYTLQADKSSQGNALEMANFFFKTNKFKYAEPNFLLLNIIQTSDTYYTDQWALENTGQYNGVSDADIDANNAWELTMGGDSINVAVVDAGVDLVHPDLSDNILTGFDATGLGSGGAPSGTIESAHGTACAGIIAAKANNGIGITGVAPNCKILPARAIFGDASTDTWLADCINWAWQNGADIINNSWGGGSPSTQITDAIEDALIYGREGLGCVILFASGNDKDATPLGNAVSYPANLDGVIAVGAMSMCNQRKRGGNPTVSCDGVETWASNYGSELDVVAPGVKISTTDISGTNGYNNNAVYDSYNDDYLRGFSGTSAACPYAAGVCALILSVNRCLSGEEVKRILELSCDRIGYYCYTPGKPNGPWNIEMGYGRVNALTAVQYAFSMETNSFYNISGTDDGPTNQYSWVLSSGGCSQLSGATYSVKRHEVNASVTYPYTQSPIIVGSSNGFSTANPNNGDYYIQAINVTTTSATLRTFVYETINGLGQTIGWVPTNPSGINFNFTVLSSMSSDLYFQNQTVSTTQTHNAMNKIEAGRNVTGAVSVGDYTVANGANVTFHAGNEVLLADGTNIESGSQFYAYVDPFFTCTQYPMGIIANSGDSNYPPVVKEYLTTWEEGPNFVTDSDYEIKNFPNPFSNSTTIEYRIKDSQSVRISISDKSGQEIFVLQNRKMHEAGTYKISLEGFNIPSGVYFCTIEADTFKETKQMVKIQ